MIKNICGWNIPLNQKSVKTIHKLSLIIILKAVWASLLYLTWLYFRPPFAVASPLLTSTHTARSPFRDASGSVMEFVCKHSPSSPSTHPFPLTCKLNPHNRDRWLPPNHVRRIVLKYQRSAGESLCSSVCPCLRDQTSLAPIFLSHSLSLSLTPLFLLTPFSQSVCFQSPGNWPKS